MVIGIGSNKKKPTPIAGFGSLLVHRCNFDDGTAVHKLVKSQVFGGTFAI